MNAEDQVFEALEYPRFLAGVLAKVEPRKLRMLASYHETTTEHILLNAFRAEKTPEDVAADTHKFWTTMVH